MEHLSRCLKRNISGLGANITESTIVHNPKSLKGVLDVCSNFDLVYGVTQDSIHLTRKESHDMVLAELTSRSLVFNYIPGQQQHSASFRDLPLSVGVEIWSEKFRSNWPIKLGFSLKPLSNPPVSVTLVKCIVNVIIGLWISLTSIDHVLGSLWVMNLINSHAKTGDSQVCGKPHFTEPDCMSSEFSWISLKGCFMGCSLLSLLTTDDAISSDFGRIYPLAQSILNIGFALAKR